MKLFNSMGPNPHVVRMFIAELGLDIETIEVTGPHGTLSYQILQGIDVSLMLGK